MDRNQVTALDRVARYLAALETTYDEAHPMPADLIVDRATDWSGWLARTGTAFDPASSVNAPGRETSVPLRVDDIREALRLAGWKPPVEADVAVTDGLTDSGGAPGPADVVTVYTDGACTHGGLGGWAWWWGPRADQHDSGSEPFTTNNAMELWAVIAALEADHDHSPLRIVSDSAYVVNGIVEAWYESWRRNGWRNSKKQPVANRELWEELIALIAAHRAPIEWVHIRGHNKINAAGEYPPPEHVAGNQEADRLAVQARLALAASYDNREDRTPGGIVIPDGVAESLARVTDRDWSCASGCKPSQGNPCGGPRCT